MNLLPKWALVNPFPAIHDFESLTVIDQTARLYGAMQTLINEYNAFAEAATEQLAAFSEEEAEAREEFELKITKVMKEFTCSMNQYLKLNLDDTATNVIVEGVNTGSIRIPTDNSLTKASYPADAKTTGDKISAEAAVLAAALAVERERINNISALEPGSTTGDAELTDIRVGYNGEQYVNAGEAVRGQIGDVMERIGKIAPTKYATVNYDIWSVKEYLTYDGKVFETPGVYRLDAPVKAGESYLVETASITGDMALWSVYDGGGNIILHDTTKYNTTQSASAVVEIPSGGVMIAVYGYYNNNISCKKQISIIPSPLTDKKWVAYGDSLTDPATLGTGKNYVDFITIETGCIPVNLGKGGSGFLKNQKYYGRVNEIPVDADVITVFGSFNDFSFVDEGNLGTAEDDGSVETPTTIGGAMNKFLLELYARFPDIKIGLISPICWTWNNPYNGDRREKSEAYVSLIEAVAKKWSIPYLDLFHTANVRLWDTNTSKKYTINNDGTHLTEDAHKKFIYKKVKSFLEVIC